MERTDMLNHHGRKEEPRHDKGSSGNKVVIYGGGILKMKIGRSSKEIGQSYGSTPMTEV